MKRHTCLAVLLSLALCCGLTLAGDSWVHVRVESDRPGAETVRVNIPLAFAEAVLPMVHVDQLVDGQLRVEGVDLAGVDLERILDELTRTGDADFVKVRDGDETVTVSKRGEFLLVNVDEPSGGTEVRVRLPLSVIHALLGDSSDLSTLDLSAALSALGEFRGDLVTVRDGGETVRIWIDENNSMIE